MIFSHFRSEINLLHLFILSYFLMKWLFYIYEFYFIFHDFTVLLRRFVLSFWYNICFSSYCCDVYLCVDNLDEQNIFEINLLATYLPYVKKYDF